MESIASTNNTINTSQDYFREESIPLITWDNDTNKFVVGEEAKQMLKGVRGPIGVIAVAGQYRTGKSYLLNRMLLNRSDGFGVGPSINPCTKGLWVWGTPISGFTPDGQPINVLVVDSEGIGGLDEDNNHDMRIFSLALLLSSYFIYNSTGSIDENALNNLSLVVNLTKHIQFKSHPLEDDTNRNEDISEYFPSFMWVVRDFALQLVDEDHNELTSREYFEKALQERGGPSDPKNEIRQHLKKYFNERECCTMIRPLTNEDELQNLSQMDLDELRAEFVEQVMQLRRKVLNKTKPKMIDGQTMDGYTWCQLIEQYVSAINEGAVPNIQSSWQYISRQRASQAVDTCKKAFEDELNESVSLPMDQQDLEYTLKDLKTVTEQKYDKLSKGDEEIIKEYYSELQEFVEQRSIQIRNNNNEECRKYAEEMIQQLFSEFDQQIKSAGPNLDANQVDITLKQLHEFYNSNAIEFSEKDLIIAEAKTSFLQELLHFFSKNYQSEIMTTRQLEAQTRERLEEQLKEAKDDSKTERYRIEDRLRELQLEKAETDASHQFLKEQYDYLKQAKEQDEQEYKAQIQSMKDDTLNNKDTFRAQNEEFEEKIQSMQRHLIQVESGFDKEKALFEQKVQYLERALSEKQAKEKDQMSDWNTQKAEMSNEIKNICQRYENDLKLITIQLEEEKEKSIDFEIQLKDKTAMIEERITKWTEIENQYKLMLNSAQDQAKTMEQAFNTLKRENEKQISAQMKEKEGKTEYYQHQVDELETQLKDTTEKLKLKENENKKETAVKDQKINFLEMQLSECKAQLEESYRQHESMVKAMKRDNSPKQKQSDTSSEIEILQNELNKTSEEYQEQLRVLKNQNDSYIEKITELELQLKLVNGDYDRDIKELKDQISETDQVRVVQQEKIRQLESQRVLIMEESENKLKQSISQLEVELEEKEQATQQELKDMQDRSEQALAQLKNFYEIEKENLEQRVAEERDRSTRRINHFQEELETRIREEVSEKEEEIEMLQNELRNQEQNNQSYMIQAEHDLSLKSQMIESLERQMKDARDRIESMESGRNSAFEKQIEHFEQQRQEYNHKIDKLQLENLEKDRQLAQLQHRLERMTDELERKKQEFDSTRHQLEKEKKQLLEKCENTKKKLVEAQDDAMSQKLEFGREQALSQQQNEFSTKKIEEMQKQIEDNQKFFDEKIKYYKQEVQDEAQAQIERITSEKELWESKYEQKRRALKEIEQSLTRTNTELERKVNYLTQQVEKSEGDKASLEANYQDEITNLQLQIQQLDSSAGAAYYYGSAHAEDVLKLKSEVQDLERELSDLQSTYDRDKALWEGKCQFLENQKETYKRDLIESQKKFEITLEQLQKRGSLDKDKFEYNQQALIKVIESKFKNQIKEINETHQCLQSDSQGKIKRLEGELKILNEKIQLDARGKMSEYGQLEKKVQELLESERKLQMELEEVRNERDRRNQDQHRQLDKEKEIYKQKLTEYEQKAKDSENRRAALMFEFEKERAKWQLEKDSLVGQKSEMYEQIERLSIKKDQLLRENEKLKNENKGSRKYLFQNVSNVQQAAPTSTSTSANRYNITKSMSGQNGNILNSAINKMKENAHKYIGSSSNGGDDSSHTTPNTKQNRYGQH